MTGRYGTRANWRDFSTMANLPPESCTVPVTVRMTMSPSAAAARNKLVRLQQALSLPRPSLPFRQAKHTISHSRFSSLALFLCFREAHSVAPHCVAIEGVCVQKLALPKKRPIDFAQTGLGTDIGPALPDRCNLTVDDGSRVDIIQQEFGARPRGRFQAGFYVRCRRCRSPGSPLVRFAVAGRCRRPGSA